MLPYHCYRQQIECIEHPYFKTKCKIDNRTGANEFCKYQPKQKLWKKTKATQKRKGPSSNKPQKIAKLLPFPDRGELELSQPPSTSQRHANTVSAKPDLQQHFLFPNTFLQLPPSQNPVIDFSTPARDFKDSFQGVTVQQLMPKIVAQTPQQKYSPNQNLTSYPTFPNPSQNSYVIAILKYCHKNISVYYGCSGRFRENGYLIPPNDMITRIQKQSESNID